MYFSNITKLGRRAKRYIEGRREGLVCLAEHRTPQEGLCRLSHWFAARGAGLIG